MNEAETLARLRLARTDGIGTVRFRQLLERFGSGLAALEALPRWPARRDGGRFEPPAPGAVRREYDTVREAGGRFLFWQEEGYPELLSLIGDPPAVLAVLGDPAVLALRQVAIVGARNASAPGRRIAEEIAAALAGDGIAVTSGLARGVDTAAHEGALRKGRTVAVLPGGLDIAYPPENARLQERVAAEGGALVAEHPLGTQPSARHFPRRNRIVAGLSLGVVVVEAAMGSGTLLTAQHAIEAGREVFAVPGSPLDPRCRGSNDLLRQGATLCEHAGDVLAHLPEAPRPVSLLRPEAGRKTRSGPGPEALDSPSEPSQDASGTDYLLDLIGYSPVAVDEILRRCHLSHSDLQGLVADLEISGRIEVLPGNRIVRSAVAGREDTSERK
ncbi:DNA-processing protein DprA [Roseomonas gilardii]|uniref:DNA-processing protein DprA n=1 Tax=Roseomonas gilardii TaxID=257708 RepID=UPI0011AA4D31|nr:DNA-processing protein DprA [Roseomonas gilardii]